MRTGPCIRCGKGIDWEHDLCERCERIMEAAEELGETIDNDSFDPDCEEEDLEYKYGRLP